MRNPKCGLADSWNCGLVLFGILLSGCGPTRPNNVPVDAIWVPGGKTVWWERCSYDPKQDLDKCQTFNEGGLTLEDEPYLAYDGGRPALQSELVIDPDAALAGPYVICLKNGRILLPQSHFASNRKFVDDFLRNRKAAK
jgi:hypothetical protein